MLERNVFVNGQFVDDELIRIEAAGLRQQLRAQDPLADEIDIGMRAQEWARQNVIDRVILRIAAEQDPTPVSRESIETALLDVKKRYDPSLRCILPEDEDRIRERIEVELRIKRLLNGLTANTQRPKLRVLKEFYRQNRAFFVVPEVAHAAHIVKNMDETKSESESLAEITKIQGLLASGATFEAVADEFSDCPGRGGDLGFFARGEMVEEFENVVFSLRPGQVSGIFRSPFGFHMAKLYERNPARLRSFDEVRERLENLLWNRAREAIIAAYIADLRSRAEVRKSNCNQQ